MTTERKRNKRVVGNMDLFRFAYAFQLFIFIHFASFDASKLNSSLWAIFFAVYKVLMKLFFGLPIRQFWIEEKAREKVAAGAVGRRRFIGGRAGCYFKYRRLRIVSRRIVH